ncbi:MAG: ABC transporter ATP-binding protein, partial [Gemmatimonadetes bacterium]|nr:ABC transporter ATP-binding protein [Gemmatimonadota bacterium]
GGYQVMHGVMTLGTLIAFLQYTGRLFDPVQSLHNLYMDLVRGMVSMRRVLEFMQLPTQEATHAGHKPFIYNRTIELQDVHFHFDDQPVLRGVNLKLAKGKSYALVGASGSGKTTLANMLCAFYTPAQGRILIDDVPLEDIQLREVRSHVSLVSQQVHLFDDTIWHNIRYGNFEREPAEAEIERVIDQVGLNGLDVQETIGEQGVQLSGGQKQRIALARTLLRPVDLLILDEATAALDAESEATLFRRVQQLYREQTILLISHRLSAVQGVDEVICLADGRVVEQGQPEVLRQKQGYYTQFVQHQQDAALELTG